MQYADYDFYVNTYLGNTIDENDFPRLSMRASEYIYSLTRGLCEKVPHEQRGAVQLAVCAVAEVLLDEQRMTSRSFSADKTVSGETVGSYSVSYGSPSLSTAEVEYLGNRKKDAVLLYLSEIPALSGLFKVRSFQCIHRTQ